MNFTLKDGRKLTLNSFFITNTLNALDLDKPSIRDGLVDFVSQHHGDTPFHLIGNDDPPPKYLCLGTFNSLQHVCDTDAWGSYALLVWFVHHDERNLRELIQPCIDICNWDAIAADYYWQ